MSYSKHEEANISPEVRKVLSTTGSNEKVDFFDEVKDGKNNENYLAGKYEFFISSFIFHVLNCLYVPRS